MKTLFAIIAICMMMNWTMSISCAATQYCMGCSSTNVCSSCFNWGSGTVGARSLASSTCTATLTRTVSNAKFYSGTHTNTSVWASGAASCKSGKYFQVDQTAASPYTPTCTSTLATGATAITDCEYTSVVKTSTSAATAYCGMCKKGKAGNAATTACSGTNITNCDYEAGVYCAICKSGYAVNSAATACTAFTTDSNCRALASDSTCGTCWAAYYFNGTTCKLFAKLLSAGLAIAISAFLF